MYRFKNNILVKRNKLNSLVSACHFGKKVMNYSLSTHVTQTKNITDDEKFTL